MPGTFLDPIVGSSPQAVDFATGAPTTEIPPSEGEASSNDLWYLVAGIATSTLTVAWTGVAVGLEVWIGPSDGVLDGAEDLTLLAYGAPPLSASIGPDVNYYVRVHPLVAADNASTGELSWSTAPRDAQEIALSIGNDLYDPPAHLDVIVTSATENDVVEFEVDGAPVAEADADDSGQLIDWSVLVDELDAGTHVLTARDRATGQLSSKSFQVIVRAGAGETVPFPDDPGPVPGPDGVIRWLVRDLDATEEYSFPNNPSQMDSPHAARQINTDHTTHPDGQPILFEGAPVPRVWNVEGAALSQAHVEKLEEFLASNARWWVIDHLKRAWLCTFEGIDWQEIKDVTRPYAQRYRMRLNIYDGPKVLS